jgi:DNA-binding beta-propeller fold protein YncE
MNYRMKTRTNFALAALGTLLLAATVAGQPRAADAHVSRCNAAATEPVTFVPMPGHPFNPVASSDGCWLFVSVTTTNPRAVNGVALFSRADGQLKLKQVFMVEGGPTGSVLTHDGKLLIVADDDYVVFMDTARMTSGHGDPILGYISDGDSPGIVYVNVTADDKFLFVSDENAETITVINLQKARAEGFKESTIVGKIPTGAAPIALTFSPDGRWLYTTSQIAPKDYNWPVECKPEGADPATAQPRYPKGAIIVVDVARAETDPANSIVARVPAGCSPVRLAIAPDGSRAYVTARNSNALLAFDTTKFQTDLASALVGTVPVGTSPVGVAVVNDGRQIILTNSNRFASDQKARQTLTVIDAAQVANGKSAVMGSIKAGIFPRQISQSPDGRTLFVSNYNSNELELIDLTRLPLDRAVATPPARPYNLPHFVALKPR